MSHGIQGCWWRVAARAGAACCSAGVASGLSRRLTCPAPAFAYAELMSERLGVDVELYQADLLELGDWDRRFDVIVCTGYCTICRTRSPAGGTCADFCSPPV